ncbi:MAG: hypothetical protein Q7W38_11990, partial [Deltaproteobacteria bacterium]|nr:hypothetical protein [Deltaproteobacteria bacterium]
MTDQNSYQELSKLLGAPTSKILPRIIEKIADEKEIKILLAAFPAATVPELSNKTGITQEKVEEMVKTLFLKGLLFISKKEG